MGGLPNSQPFAACPSALDRSHTYLVTATGGHRKGNRQGVNATPCETATRSLSPSDAGA
jgi:hypothetical protein